MEGKTMGGSKPDTVSTKLRRIAELARQMPEKALHTLAHHIDEEFLREAYRRVRKDGAPGVDRQTVKDYAGNLDANLGALLNRFKTGLYRAPPVRRVYIPKGDGKSKRPIGIPTVEDKILQRAVTMVLEAVYEQDFLNCSYGFRRGRSAHDALDALRERLVEANGGWVLDVDIKCYFDEVSHEKLREILDQRVQDGVLKRAIGKWMKAGVLEDRQLWYPRAGVPQGGVISPMLANIYLHEVLDKWFEAEVRPRLRRGGHLVRYADDLVIVCALEEDARRVMRVLAKRLGKYGLRMHPEKSRVVNFRRPRPEAGRRPGTFDFLGFTHYWGRSRKGRAVVKKKTAKDRFSRFLKRIALKCKRDRHEPIVEQHRYLCRAIIGHDIYYGVTGNALALSRLRFFISRIWHKWLGRRSNSRRLTWERFGAILKRFPLPPVRIRRSIYRRPAAKPCT
jgi:group II intron reverse transcriptase/maturase